MSSNDDTFNGERVAYIFPGQGSQSVGMGKELYNHYPSARRIFDEIDAALDVRLTRILFEGPEDKLKETINAQPAILATSLALLEIIRENDDFSPNAKPAFVAGHSLGEYTALVASNALSVVDAALLVRERGRLMQEASEKCPGGMAAVLGLDESEVEEICAKSDVQISNINSDYQIVLSGDHKSLEHALDLASNCGAKKIIKLEVSGAFHSSLMSYAEKKMEDLIASKEFRCPDMPIVANSSGKPMTAINDIRRELSRQLCHCVQWKRSMEFLISEGVLNFVEIGPGRVLSGLVRTFTKTAKITNVNEFLAKSSSD